MTKKSASKARPRMKVSVPEGPPPALDAWFRFGTQAFGFTQSMLDLFKAYYPPKEREAPGTATNAVLLGILSELAKNGELVVPASSAFNDISKLRLEFDDQHQLITIKVVP